MYLIGTDEAGYGPNLGPLVISASVWQIAAADFSALSSDLNAQGIRIGDSKKIYHSGNLNALESTALSAVLLTTGALPDDLSELRRRIADTQTSDVPSFPIKVPYSVSRETMTQRAETFQTVLRQHGVKLLAVRSKILTAAEFNRLLDTYPTEGAKASLLSNATLELVAMCVKTFCADAEADTVILCDKHGGRNRYLDLLMQFFPDGLFQTLQEGRQESVYRRQNIEFRFIAQGEKQMPIALSSMLSKYLRELAMLEFNGYWQERIPGLKPTAGYPEDAKRFVKDAAGEWDIEQRWRKR